MKSIEARLQKLEASRPHVKSEIEEFLEKLTDEELERYAEIAKRTEDGQKELNEDESTFLKAMVAKYESY